MNRAAARNRAGARLGRRGTLFVVSAPSGAGKTTLCREARLCIPDLAYSVSATTRAPRPGEVNGVDFRFVSEREFRTMLERGELAEWATVHGNMYGTPARPLEAALADGKDVLLDIDTQGAAQLRTRYPEAVLVFIVAPRWPSWSSACASAAPTRRVTSRAGSRARAKRSRCGERTTI